MLLAALSVDLDEIPCYAAIHGLDASLPASTDTAHVVYDRALGRLSALFARLEVPCTFFAIGSDLERAENGAKLRTLREAGHEIASHSQSHYYDLTRRSGSVVRSEIEDAHRAIERATGKAPVGFRAPGYTITDAVFSVLEELGYAYDSSVFPCPSYFAAKALAIYAYRARGRESRSIVDDPRVLTAPADPYRIGHPYWRRGGGLLELPIGVTRDGTGRMPYIGTSVVLSGAAGARVLTEAAVGRPLVNLELHGIDLADSAEDGLSWLVPHQPDLRRPVRSKEAALESAIVTLRRHGYRFVTLEQAARELS